MAPEASALHYPPPKALEFIKPFKFLMEDDDRWMNLLFGAILMLIPIVGPIVAMGWQMVSFQNLVKQQTKPIPRFDFANFGTYLGKGIIPFLVSLILMLPFFVVIVIIAAVAGVGIPALASQGLPTEFILLSIAIGLLAVFIFGFLPMVVFANAGITRAYLTEDFGKAFDIGKLWSYGQGTWKNIFLAYIVYLPISIALMFAGMILLYVGMYAAMVIMNFAWIYMSWQIYELYVKAGGEPIPLKPEAIPQAPPSPPAPQSTPA